RQPATVRQKSDESINTIQVQEPKESLLVVHIQPLNREQVRVFSKAREVKDAESFIQALDDHFAWEFARRPLDVVDLINYWKENKKLGTLTELLEFSTERKLRAAEKDTSDPLS